MKIDLTHRQAAIIQEALDSYVYWQLSDEHYRNDGFVEEPGSDDPDNAQVIVEANELHDMFEALRAEEEEEEAT